MADIFDATDLADLRGEHVCCDYTCTYDGTMRRAAAEIDRLRAIVRVNGLRWGYTHAEIDAILAGNVEQTLDKSEG